MASKKFTESVFEFCRRIPRGRVSTYAQLAMALGRPGAARAVGSALKKNKYLIKIPCHRVVLTGGRIGSYQKGTLQKMKLLQSEGVKIKKGRIVEFDKYLFKF